MKVFTIVAVILLVISLPVFSGGQPEPAPMMSAEADTPMVEFINSGHAMMLAESKPTVLFFNASWCPSCKSAVRDFEKNMDDLAGINLVLVDYDNSDDLQKKYGVTYQHTFVQIDSEGESLVKWNGGDIKELLEKIVKDQ
ncbi:MAG TPA: hypothetical protein DCO79_09905 [Spirochaeta sp.]|nr:hypothetical protein [Spirochaeta sp.]